ncbi:radical SAM family heme chaperone HemW [Salmonirosea aquatica]|uniref:Heme chaperone HemW n=1 Tax=Salmonirosea aquatica TaxID=2654236 RepID=A0A7C9FXI1_9BACT|nr:radical SAM family heme chaperone HemW [Cytophagaceae bacterium SJW1-29]
MHLYVHIPFCRQACHYCDFHFSTSLRDKGTLVQAIASEIRLQKDYLPGRVLQTVYFGGGTPSLLTESELALLLETIGTHFQLRPDAEITLEANPDDLSEGTLRTLASQGINRLSIGIQSFHDPHLRFMNRAHSAEEAERSVKSAQDIGITNLTADLIYAIPSADDSLLQRDIEKMLSLEIDHISAYCLTIEPKTVFGNWVKSNKIQPIDDEYAAGQFELLMGTLQQHGFDQYEISNFARNQKYSLHNSAYWQRRPYLGVGPSAHSYNGASRQYNIANNAAYVREIAKSKLPFTLETLTPADQVNEYLLTGLRTRWGCRLELLQVLSNGQFLAQMGEEIFRLSEVGWLCSKDGVLLLTEKGKLFADRVAGSLFIED